ncbi:MAG: iron donor protein CyaY [Myxococcales bacterium]
MDEATFERLAAETFERVLDLFEDVDPDDADVEPTGDVIRIAFANGQKIVLNTQRPARQLWLAGGKSAWHFDRDAEQGTWVDHKGRGELFEVLRRLTHEASGIRL